MKKIAKNLANEINESKYGNGKKCQDPSPLCYRGEYLDDYNEETSSKFKKLFPGILNDSNTRIDLDSNTIDIRIDNSNPTNKGGNYPTPCNDIEIRITKDIGFKLRMQNYLSCYTDTNIYIELLPIIKENAKLTNSNNFLKIWNECVKNTKIMRNINLNNLLGDE